MKKEKDKIKEILERNVEEKIEEKHLEEVLSYGKKLRIKHGVDPTGPNIHIGRAIQLWKLRAFQDLGHKIVLIIGDFTARIGDPSDKPEGRKGLTEKEIKKNLSKYLEQISKILDLEKTEVRYNSEWFNSFNLQDFLYLANSFSIQQLIHRRNFKERWKDKKPISLTEIIYPILQGYDSVMVKADMELGGYDQLFNLKMGREIQKIFKQKPQDIMTLKMLYGLDGRKMSTSWKNVVNINDKPNDMYGKLMSMTDDMILPYFQLCTLSTEEELKKIEKELKKKDTNPRDIKADLAEKIVEFYHGKKSAQTAQKEFDKIFKNKEIPTDIRILYSPKKEYDIVELLVGLEFAKSNTQAKKLIEQGAVKINNEKITDYKKIIKVKEGMIIQSGKRNFVKLTLKL